MLILIYESLRNKLLLLLSEPSTNCGIGAQGSAVCWQLENVAVDSLVHKSMSQVIDDVSVVVL